MLRYLALVAGLFLAGLSLAPSTASAAPVAQGQALATTTAAPVETVQYYYGRPRRYYGRRYYGRPRYYGRRYYAPRRFYGPPRFYGPRPYYGPRRYYGY